VTDQGSVEAYAHDTGKCLWKLDYPAYSVLAADGTVYLLTRNANPATANVVIAVDIRSGKERWRVAHTELGDGPDLQLDLAGPGFLAIAKRKEESLNILQAKTGKLLWSSQYHSVRPSLWKELNQGRSAVSSVSAPTATCPWKKSSAGPDPLSAARRWPVPSPVRLISAPGPCTGQTPGEAAARLHGRAPDTLEILWQTSAAQPNSGPMKAAWDARLAPVLTPPVAAGTRVFVATTEAGQVKAFDMATGEAAWTVTLGSRIDSAPTILGNLCVIGSHDGWVYAPDKVFVALEDGNLLCLGSKRSKLD